MLTSRTSPTDMGQDVSREDLAPESVSDRASEGPRRCLRSFWTAFSYPILSCAIVLGCIAIAKPFANCAFNDDWSYSHVALQFAQTGRFHYNGWGSPTILFQTLWGAAWIRLFGFSFDVLRAATIPFALGFVVLVYALGRKVGLTRGLALFAAIT
ncbi:MAG TPA: hypothetical protein VNH18_08190, partial [Bryobacteraceae bacterium]|nr:hypothetical protein [Bryobacteraceae bacterium]